MTSTSTDSDRGTTTTGGQCENMWLRGNYIGEKETTINRISTNDLICWSFQIASGMEYLTNRRVIHGDLAARNVLLSDGKIVKIADFGLSREVYQRTGNYKKKTDGPLPIKWMAPESIVDRIFSSQTDVWSFGILLWELFSLGKTPYPGIEPNEIFVEKILNGYRLEKPKYAFNELYCIMQECWDKDPKRRPTFYALCETIGNLLEAPLRRQYIELNTPYVIMNKQRGINTSNDYSTMMNKPDYMNMNSVPGLGYVNTSAFSKAGAKESDCLPTTSLQSNDTSGYLNMSGLMQKSAGADELHRNPCYKNSLTEKAMHAEHDESEALEMTPILKPNEKDQLPETKQWLQIFVT